MTTLSRRAIATIGNAADQRAWSGIPYHFWRAGLRSGFVSDAIDVPLDAVRWRRRRWAVGRTLRGRQPAGFQYSTTFLDWAESKIPPELLATEIISFSQHFPRAATVRRAGGRISYYIDATLAAMTAGRALDLRLPEDVAAAACAIERENYALADRVVTMARWAADSVLAECGVPREKVSTVLPGANLQLPANWSPPTRVPGRPGRDRPLVLGFVGKDWQRKGLPLVVAVRDELAARGWNVVVRAIGEAPTELAGRPGVEFLGFIDKASELDRFVKFLAGCDVGCLFSKREALGISTLEFLRVGVPVAGFAIEGPADALPADAAFRFASDAPVVEIADALDSALALPERLAELSDRARQWSALVTWDRCLAELQEIWRGTRLNRQAQPWLGYANNIKGLRTN